MTVNTYVSCYETFRSNELSTLLKPLTIHAVQDLGGKIEEICSMQLSY